MNVTCPECRTIYRVDPAKIPDRGVIAQCARCPGEFIVDGTQNELSALATDPGVTVNSAHPVEVDAVDAATVPEATSGWTEDSYRRADGAERGDLNRSAYGESAVSSHEAGSGDQPEDELSDVNASEGGHSSSTLSSHADLPDVGEEGGLDSDTDAADQQGWEDDGAPVVPTADVPGLVVGDEDQWEGSWRRSDADPHDEAAKDIERAPEFADSRRTEDAAPGVPSHGGEGWSGPSSTSTTSDESWNEQSPNAAAEAEQGPEGSGSAPVMKEGDPSDGPSALETEEDRIELVGVDYHGAGDPVKETGLGEETAAGDTRAPDAAAEEMHAEEDAITRSTRDEEVVASDAIPEAATVGDLRATEEAEVLAGFSAAPPAQTGAGDLPPPPFGSTDPHVRARRLARALVSDIVVYHPDRRERSLRDGTLRQEFREEIRKSWDEYVGHVGEQIARDTSYFRDALNDLLAGGTRLF